jgi:tetratricopeptide (TPR) repeat protein
MNFLRRNVEALKGDLVRERFDTLYLPAVSSRAWLGWCLAEVGAFAEGIAISDAAVQEAEVVDYPFSLVQEYVSAGVLYLRKGDFHKAIHVLERGLELCQATHLPLWFPWNASALGMAYALSGRLAEALPLLERAIEQGASKRLMVSHALEIAYLGEAQVLAGRLDEAHALAEGALAYACAHQERGHQAYVLRLLGEIATQREPPEVETAEAHYRQALTLAKELGMRPLQAHCSRGLGTLYAKTGQQEQARRALATAIAMYQAMDMTFWLSQAEAALAVVGGVCNEDTPSVASAREGMHFAAGG